MNKRTILFALSTVLAPAMLISSSINNVYAAEWSYSESTGPDKWASLALENTLCGSGKNQSPVDIDSKKTFNINTRGLKFNYGMILPRTITNTGNLLQVKIGSGTNIKVDDIEFELKGLDFHIPSEHTIDGKHFPMELQFIHESADKQIAIVSRMVVPGRPDRTLSKLLDVLPMKAGETAKLTPSAFRNIEMRKKYGNYYRYNGSTTTPPCTEGVRWFLIKNPMSFSKEQYEKLQSAVKKDNNRPAQKLNARIIAH